MLAQPGPLLFGADPTPGLLAFALAEDGRHVRCWRRTPEGVGVETEPFRPFLLIADPRVIEGAEGLEALEPLDGRGVLRWLARFVSWPSALAARARCRHAAQGADAPRHWFADDPVHQYLLASGRVSFRGLAFVDLHRLALDIEVVSSEGEFPRPARAGDRIVAIALADSRGFREVLRGDRLEEPDLLAECGRIIRAIDPDVIEGHNVFRFDLDYIEGRARRHGVALAWGRDGSVLRGRPSRLPVGERSLVYHRYEVAGRHVVDTWMLAQLHDLGARDLPSFGLKDIARHFGVAAEGRTYLDAGAIDHVLREAPDRLMAYAADDAAETLAVAAILAPPHFAQAQLLPFDYQSVTLRGAAAKVDALLLREHLRRRHAVPAPRPPAPVGGGHVALYQQGVARPVLHVDVTSLYPSLMLALGIAPAADDLGVFTSLLRHLTEVRVHAKRLALEREAPEERAHFGALQQSFKLLINSFYGYLAFPNGHWNDFEAANRVTAEGRAVVRGIIERLGALGAVVVEADTDGVYFVPPPGHTPADDEPLLAALAAGLPEGVRLELDGRYAAMLGYKAKTYALLDARGRLSLKGSAFRSRGLEPFQRELIAEIVRALCLGRGGEVKAIVDRWLDDFAARRVPARAFARTETLGETLDAYQERLRAGQRNVSAAYELARASGRAWQPGDQVSYYVSGRGAQVAVSERARLLGAWDPDRRDENVEYYQARVQEIWTRFRPFVEHEGLRPPPVEEADDGSQLSLF